MLTLYALDYANLLEGFKHKFTPLPLQVAFILVGCASIEEVSFTLFLNKAECDKGVMCWFKKVPTKMGWNWAIWAGTELPLLSSSTAGPVPGCSCKTLCHSLVTSHLSSHQSSFVCFTHPLLPDINQDRWHGRGALSVVICSCHLYKTSNLGGLLSANRHTKPLRASARAGIGESIRRAGWLKHQDPQNVPGRCYWTTFP